MAARVVVDMAGAVRVAGEARVVVVATEVDKVVMDCSSQWGNTHSTDA